MAARKEVDEKEEKEEIRWRWRIWKRKDEVV